MSTTTEVPANEAVIVMSRTYDAPREMVWEAMTEAGHVAQWWGGPGFTNPVCEMDVRPGGLWRHVMRFPDGHELHMKFVFIVADKPKKLVWQPADSDQPREGPPGSMVTVTLDDLGRRTRWKMMACFQSVADRDAALSRGFTRPIALSNDRLVDYLAKLRESGK